jgi:predicted transcriptional regulator
MKESYSMEKIDRDRIALGVKQPWAELILQGEKTLEIRSRPTNICGRIYLYTSKKKAQEDFALQAVQTHQLEIESLPTGLLVGSVEIIGCRKATARDEQASCVPGNILTGHYAWELGQPQRFQEPLPVRFLPYGVWFYPFKRREK